MACNGVHGYISLPLSSFQNSKFTSTGSKRRGYTSAAWVASCRHADRATPLQPTAGDGPRVYLGSIFEFQVLCGCEGEERARRGREGERKNVRQSPARHQPWQALLNDPSAKTHTSVHAPYHQLTPVYISSYHKRSFRPMHHTGARTMYPGGVRDNMGPVHLPSACGHGHESLAAAMQRCPRPLPRASPSGLTVYWLLRCSMGIRTDTLTAEGHGME